MATSEQVREYLAHWFQLGKPVVQPTTGRQYLPQPIFHGSGYSKAFNHCWQQVTAHGGQDWWLSGTDYSIADLLSGSWDITPCARCEMPVAMRTMGVMSSVCPCNDLKNWPNTDVPKPRLSADSQQHLGKLHQRLGGIDS